MSIVQVPYKTGIYIGRVLEDKNQKTLIQVLAVNKHPNQGDLHHPKNAEVPFFHERKALAENEKVWVPTDLVKEYEEEIPDYQESLRMALEELIMKLERDSSLYAEKAIQNLESLKRDYRLT